jgi:hypothetical protein
MHWFTIINNIKQLHWLSLWLQSKLQILSNNNVALKNAVVGGAGGFDLFLQALQSAFKPPSSIWSQFYRPAIGILQKKKGSVVWSCQKGKQVGKPRVVNSSTSRPHEERLVRRICGYQTLFVLRLNRKGLHQTFSCFVVWDLTNTLRALCKPIHSEHVCPWPHGDTMFIYLSHSAWREFDTTAELLFVPAL